MLVYKFGGMALKDADRMRALLPILKRQKNEKLVLLVSAMGKMTNAFERLHASYRSNDKSKDIQFQAIKKYHFDIIAKLFEEGHPVFDLVNTCFENVLSTLKKYHNEAYDFSYDQTVSYGELLSSLIVSEFLADQGIENCRLDASELLVTNEKYRDARINWNLTKEKIASKLLPEIDNSNLIITQGFIGGTHSGIRTTIGREGSDFSAAIFAHFLDAKELTVWKDVPGILNADPKKLPKARQLNHLSYHETVELAYYGASVIHPRTLQPLKAKRIPLYIRSFLNPEQVSLIDDNNQSDGDIASFIIKENQILFTIASRDFSFIDAEKLTGILKLFSVNHFHIRLIQNSALNFSLVADENPLQLDELLAQLQEDYSVKYNRNLSLLTVRHLQDSKVSDLFKDTEVLLEMHSRMTQQFVLSSETLASFMTELNDLV
ncbi:MAG: aspartate kinase [Bacteroidales bacterium]|nr:aspartate kinase [Bacteroidales bacterium]